MGLLMAYTLHADNVGSDARWMALAKLQEPEGAPDVLELTPAKRRAYLARLKVRSALLLSAHFLMSSESALNTDDGYLTQEAALACCVEPWILKALLTPACGKPPFVHTKGQKCAEKNCIDASGPWRDGYEYRLCAFLKRNPSKAEQERRKAQRDDSRDSRLRTFVYERDGGCCRFCRSGPLNRVGMGKAKDTRRAPEYDHGDPDRDAGPNAENLFLLCKRCNRDKSDSGTIRRTVREFGWPLLPAPSEELKAYWKARGEKLFDRPEPTDPSPADTVPDTYRDTATDTDSDTDRGGVDTPVPDAVQPLSDAAVHAGETAGDGQEHPSSVSSAMSGSGRVGQPPVGALVGPLGQPLRDSSAPDIYHRRSRAPEPRAGPP